MIPAEPQSQFAGQMPELTNELAALVSIPSVSHPAFSGAHMRDAAIAVQDLLTRFGADRVQLLEGPLKFPAVFGELDGPPDAPTVLLYSHYDVQPPGDPAAWISDPWSPQVRDGRLYGRGAADDKSGIVMHAATVRAMLKARSVNLKILIEGEEETQSNLAAVLTPELVRCDVAIIADSGNLVVGHPCLTTSLRGVAVCDVTVKTGRKQVHSGLFGGVAVDALHELVGALASLSAETVPALRGRGGDYTEPSHLLRALTESGARIAGDVRSTDQGPIAHSLWVDGWVSPTRVEQAFVGEPPGWVPNEAHARVAIRTPPNANAEAVVSAISEALTERVAGRAAVSLTVLRARDGLMANAGPLRDLALECLNREFGLTPTLIGSGASIPAAELISRLAPTAETIIWGPQDMAASAVHGVDESVDLLELERMTKSQISFVEQIALRKLGSGL